MNTNERFNRLLYDIGYFINEFHTITGKTKIIFDDDSLPISKQALCDRYQQWLTNNGLQSDVNFQLVVKLPTYKVDLR